MKGGTKKKKSLSAGTIRNLKTYLSAILSETVDDEIIGFNPAAGTGKLIKKGKAKEIFPYTWDEKAKFEKATYAHGMPGGKKSEVDELDGQQAPGTDNGHDKVEVANEEKAKKNLHSNAPYVHPDERFS